MTRPLRSVLVSSAALAAATLLLSGCGTRHAADPALIPPAATTQLDLPAPTTTRNAATPAAATSAPTPGNTPVTAARGSSPTDLGTIRSDLTGAGNAAGAAEQHLSSGAAAASQPDTP